MDEEYAGKEKRWDGLEQRKSPPEIHEIMRLVHDFREESREAHKNLAFQVRCLKKSIEPFEPMLQDMLDTRQRMRGLRWNLATGIGITALGAVGTLIVFITHLIWEWSRRQ
jgi:hypothetical protein